MTRPLVVAHRGASCVAPENTLEAFEAAISLGADMVELDVRSTADGTLIVVHDEAVGGHALRAHTYAELCAALPSAPPRLEQVVDACAGRIALDVELKEPGVEDRVLEIVGARLDPEAFVVTSFLDDAVAAVKRRRADVRVGLLLARAESPADAFRRLEVAGGDFVAPHFTLADADFLAEAAARGLETVVWTVNDEEQLRRFLADARIAAIVTDDPALALRLRP